MRSFLTRDAEIEFTSAPVDGIVFPELGGFSYALKGVADRIAAAGGLVVLGLPMLVIAVLIKLTSPGPVIVKQERIGRFGRPFWFYKFRSMRADAEMLRDQLEEQNHHDDPLIFKMRRDPRVTRVGAFIRRTSLDELPNLFNVLKGEMSVVGPRPPLPREVAHYNEHHMQRLAATPGITGLWQVKGRSEIGFEDMVNLDLEYIERWSLWLDITIAARTPFAVIGGRGAW